MFFLYVILVYLDLSCIKTSYQDCFMCFVVLDHEKVVLYWILILHYSMLHYISAYSVTLYHMSFCFMLNVTILYHIMLYCTGYSMVLQYYNMFSVIELE